MRPSPQNHDAGVLAPQKFEGGLVQGSRISRSEVGPRLALMPAMRIHVGMSLSWVTPVVLATALLPACGGSGASVPIGIEQSTQTRITNPSVPAGDASELASDNRAFAVDLYQALRAQSAPGTNLVFSPASLSIALAMLYSGAATETATQIDRKSVV